MSEENKTKELKTSENANKSVPKKPAKKTNQIAGQGMKKDTVTTLLFKTNHQNFAEVFNHTVLAKAPISPEDLQEEDIKETALQVLDELTHAPELKELRAPQYQTQEGEFNMSTAIQEMILEGKQEGRKEGRKEGKREGRKQGRAEGKKEGKLEQAQKTAKNLQRLGLDEASIAKMVEMELGLVRQWLQADE